ncbi:pentapeptide repeat-containing protein [Tenacibaculum sp. ZS6-P6]|uniref:pentapeptide repeat-containing protein n=1 Tax=Tenacibaculum sp. ZS6-P6 TaxID=3447503 RepID=UPI003F9ACB05
MRTITTLLLLFTSSLLIAQKTVNATEILKTIEKEENITISNATIVGVLDLTYMNKALPNLPKRKRWWNNGGSNTIEKQIVSKISFINCVFEDDVLAYIPHEDSGYTFVANFEDDVTFRNCTFEGKSMFKYSDFEYNTDFSGSKFLEDTTFKYASFDKDISFKNTNFDEPATFKYAKFRKFVSFANSIFQETTTFKYTEFNGGVSFNNVKFEEDLNIKYMEVSGEFDIKNMIVNYDIDSKYTKINGRSFNSYLFKK